MSRWHWVAVVLLLAPVALARGEEAPAGADVAQPAAGAGTGVGEPAPGTEDAGVRKPARIAAPLIGQAVAVNAEVQGITVRDVALVRKRGENGEQLAGARVRLSNSGSAPVRPAFRVLLYRGEEMVGTLSFPADGTDAGQVAPGASYVWTLYTPVKEGALPDAFAVAPPQAAPSISAGGGGGEAADAGRAAGGAAPNTRAGTQGRGGQAGNGGRGGHRAERGGRNGAVGGGVPNSILRLPGMRAGGRHAPRVGGGLNTPGMRRGGLAAPGMRATPLSRNRRRR